MQSEFNAVQFDDVLQFITDTSGLDRDGFSNFMDDLDRYHPTFQLWAAKNVRQVKALDTMFRYLHTVWKVRALGYDFQRFLQFVFETYGFDQEGVEAFNKSLG